MSIQILSAAEDLIATIDEGAVESISDNSFSIPSDAFDKLRDELLRERDIDGTLQIYIKMDDTYYDFVSARSISCAPLPPRYIMTYALNKSKNRARKIDKLLPED